MEVLLWKSKDSSLMFTKNLVQKLTLKLPTNFFARLSEVNSTFTAELVRNNNELNKKLTREIAKINLRDAGYISET